MSESPLRVLLVVHEYFPRHWAGTEQVCRYLARSLVSRGHQVRIFTREDAPAGERPRLAQESVDGIQVYRLHWSPPSRRGVIPVPAAPVRRAFRRVLRDFEPEVVHFQHLVGLSPDLVKDAGSCGARTWMTLNDFWFLCHRIKLVRSDGSRCGGPKGGRDCAECVHGDSPWPQGALRAAHRARHRRFRALLNRVDHVLAPSAFLAEVFSRHWPERDIDWSDYGIDAVGIRAAADEARRLRRESVDDSVPRVLFCGSLIHEKGARLFLDALERIRADRWSASVHGDPAVDPGYGAEIVRRAERIGVRMAGAYGPGESGKILGQGDLLVVPSGWWENRPVTILEAFAAGVPVITARLGGMEEMVRSGRGGWTFEPDDPVDLARVLDRALADPAARRAAVAIAPEVKNLEVLGEEMEGRYRNGLVRGAGPRVRRAEGVH